MDISIVITSFNTKTYLERCLRSIYTTPPGVVFELFVVDNDSDDDTPTMVRNLFPAAHLLANDVNVGFARANNRAIERAKGRFLLLLNPDTEVQPETLPKILQFMNQRPEIGVLGVKLLRDDGTMDEACRRGFPTPITALAKFLHLDRVFPKFRRLSAYNLRYLDPNGEYEVDAIVGAFMFIRRQVLEDVGFLDESFFMYGEDLDWCYRAKRRGWRIYYSGHHQVRHTKGASTQLVPARMNFHFHRAMLIFHRKHLERHYPFFVNWLISAGIAARFLLRSIAVYFRRPPGTPVQKPHDPTT